MECVSIVHRKHIAAMKRTALLVTTLVIILGIYDLVTVVVGGVDESVSRFLQRTAFGSPLISFTFGFICGHIFGYMKPEPQDTK
jgi:hypothetical protein